jgi:hypothetical protein
MATDTEFDA